MNDKKRESLKDIQKELFKLHEQLDGTEREIEKLRDEEDEYITNMPKGSHGSDLYEQALETYDSMDYAMVELDAALEYVESAIDFLKEITGEQDNGKENT